MPHRRLKSLTAALCAVPLLLAAGCGADDAPAADGVGHTAQRSDRFHEVRRGSPCGQAHLRGVGIRAGGDVLARSVHDRSDRGHDGVSDVCAAARVVEHDGVAHRVERPSVARELLGEVGEERRWYLSTQEEISIFRLGRSLVKDAPSSFAMSMTVGKSTEELTGRALYSRSFTPAEIAAGVRFVPSAQGSLYLTQDVGGVPRTAPTSDRDDLKITRKWYQTDGTEFTGILLRSSSSEVFRDLTGKERAFPEADVISRTEIKMSLMPPGLVMSLTDAELRDLPAAYLVDLDRFPRVRAAFTPPTISRRTPRPPCS